MDSFSMVAATGVYHFKINHSETKDMDIGEKITSPNFRVGQHDWAINCYPQGNKKDLNGKYVSVFLRLQRKFVDVRSTFEFALLDNDGNVSPTTLRETSHTFTSHKASWGFPGFFERTKLEKTYVKDCFFVFSVKVTIKDESCTGASASWNTHSMCFRHECIQKFQEETKGTDVTFDVHGKNFVAHRLILAAHSPVFEAAFFGSMAESNMDCKIMITEIMPSVFKAMLDFMYNGMLSVNEKLVDCEESISSTSFLQHLFAAADRYAVKNLQAACKYELVQSISLDTVLSILQLAENHNCSDLKNKCLRFVVHKDNFVSLVLSERYINLMQNYPSLLVELKELAEKQDLV
ncbi:BTB/POZ and MATH domain-containing protein 2-like protein [Carex littledalei]|uniref:BTB/POZ and MATH domain-containing protein 2-like protein n=1 Tax=Carex littledalei TaxID=544730 RepID=A0A833R9V2_9POAL|nr:BTB/POZ and MATH domain-containing protein 2-like protein [Carex littledalei]